MSVVIIGGNERMEQQYKQICRKHQCKAKVFTRMSGNLKTADWPAGFDYPVHFYGGTQDGSLCAERGRALQYPCGADRTAAVLMRWRLCLRAEIGKRRNVEEGGIPLFLLGQTW